MGLNLYFSKVDVSLMLEVSEKQLYYALKKDFPNFFNKKKKFTDVEAFMILKHYRALMPDEELKAMIYPRKRSKIGFETAKI